MFPSRRPKRRHQLDNLGHPPGTVVVDPDAPHPVIHVFGYGADVVEEIAVTDVDQLASLPGRWPVLWVNVNGLGDATVIERIGEVFQLHPLALEDVANTHQRPKIEVYEHALYVVLRMTSWVTPGTEVDSEQLSLFLGKGFVLTFQEHTGDPFEAVRERIRRGRRILRTSGADYLAYVLLDSVVDHYFPLFHVYGEVLDELEEAVLAHPTRDTLAVIRRSRRALIGIRRSVWPLRDVAQALQSENLPFVHRDTRVYLRDLLDHVLRIIDLAESYRDQVTGLMEGYLTAVSFRMNEVMGVLTIVGTIFLPLSFLTGLYGMNFDRAASGWNMPELGLPFGYPLLLGFMAAVATGMLLYFRRRGWLKPVDLVDDEASSST